MKLNLDRLIERYFARKSRGQSTATPEVIDPVTLSRGKVVRRLGSALNRWGREVDLVDVRVIEKNAHHKDGDRVIWEIPPEEELRYFSGDYEEKLKAWYLGMRKD